MEYTEYPNQLPIREALQVYFSKYHFTNGGYHLKWFTLKIGPMSIPLPNIKARVDAVKIHDIHHLATEYPATLRGEAEIGAWEIASGCGGYSAAWVLNFGSFFYGLFFFPKALLRAFLRGSVCKTSLYYNTVYDEALLCRTIGEIREHIGLDSGKNPRFYDYVKFIVYAVVVLSMALVFFFGCYLVIITIVSIIR